MSQHTMLDAHLAHARETGDVAAEARCLMQWARLSLEEESTETLGVSAFDLAQVLYAQAAQSFAQMGDHGGQAEALSALADILARIDDPRMERMAHLLYEDVFLLYAHLNEIHAQALILTKIPHVIWRLEEQARDAFYRRALSFMEHFGDPLEKADLLILLAETMIGWPSYKEGVATFERALRICESAHDHSRQAAVLRRLGQIVDDDALALSYRTQAATLYEALDDFLSAGMVWYEIGGNATTSPIDAIPCYVRALELFQQSGDTFHQASALQMLGDLSQDSGKNLDAQIYLEKAWAIFQEFDAPSEQLRVLRRLVVLNETLNNIQRCREYYTSIFALMDTLQQQARCLWEWGLTEHRIGDRAQALHRFQQAIETHREYDATFTPSIIAEWQDELRQMGYLPAADTQETDHDL